MMTFETSGYLGLLAVVPLAIYFRHFRRGRGGRVSFSFQIYRGDSLSAPSRFVRALYFLSACSFWVACCLLIIALGGPVRTERRRVYLGEGMQIIIVLDESPSMSAQDFQPGNRFEAAKEVIRSFVSERGGDSIGLVTFSKDAALRVPPTLDRNILYEQLDALSIMSLGDGTAIGMGIAVAALHLQRTAQGGGVIVLLTDGESNTGEIVPEAAADITGGLGIRIYAIGVGTEGNVPIEYTDPETGIRRSGMFESRFNEKLLRDIAESTGGRYFSAKSPGALNAIFDTIDSAEVSENRFRIEVSTTPLHRTYIFVAFLLLAADVVTRKFLLREVLP